MITSRRGFSLVELLVCAGIVCLLATVALPNFRSAQNASSIAQAQQDMRTIKQGLEAYKLDNGDYVWQNGLPVCLAYTSNTASIKPTLERLTTPVSYLGGSAPFYDPFPADYYYGGPALSTLYPMPESDIARDCYFYNARNTRDTSVWGQTQAHDTAALWYFLESAGPDGKRHFTYQAVNVMTADIGVNRQKLLPCIYDATNGATSRGSLWDVGGDVQGYGTSMAWVIHNANASHVAGWTGY